MIVIWKMGLKMFLRHYLEISKYRDRVKLMTRLKDKIDNLSIIDKVKAKLDKLMEKKMQRL